MSASVSWSAASTAAVIRDVLAPIAQEIVVMAVFLFSYLWWRHLGTFSGQRRLAKKLNGEGSTSPAKKQFNRSIPKKEVSEGGHVASDVSPNVIEARMLQLLEQNEFTRALNMFRGLERTGREHHFSEDLFLSFIESAARVGKPDVINSLLIALKRTNRAPSLPFWRRMLKVLSSRKCFEACLSADMIFGADLPADKVVLSCLANAALTLGRPERAGALMRRYAELEDLDVKDYSLLFRTYQSLKDVDSAEMVFKKLGRETSNLMFNLLLLTCVSSGQNERAVRLLHEAHTLEQEPLEADAVPSRIVDTVSYNTVIKGLARAGSLDGCFECVRTMDTKGLQPDDITVATLLSGCIEQNDMDRAGEVMTLSLKGDYKMGTVTYTLLIKALVKADRVPRAFDVFKEMKQRVGAGPDVITYSVLIKALVARHELERALQMLQEMRDDGHALDDIILTHLLEGCRHASNQKLGQQLFDEALSAGVHPSEFTLVTLLKLYGRVGAHQEAHDLMVGWEKSHGYRPSVIHYTCLMSGCLRTKSYSMAWAAFELMKAHGVKPDGTTLSTLLPGMVVAQKWDSVFELVRASLVLPPSQRIPAATLNTALAQMTATKGHEDQVTELVELMRTVGVLSKPRPALTPAPQSSPTLTEWRRTGRRH